MEKNGTGILEQYTGSLSHRIEQEYHIGEELYRGDIKRGLRNSDGTGVPIGVTRVGSVLGYMIEDGVRIPVPGQLYYRGIELNEIVEAHRQAGTFGFEEVAYLLLMGYLPSRGELDRFNEIMNRARMTPTAATVWKFPTDDPKNILWRTLKRKTSLSERMPFENMVADYVKETGNHVLYRVTPVFEGSNLVASGVQIEAWSVEDDGEGICFNVYCYNVQPGVEIDYASGESQAA